MCIELPPEKGDWLSNTAEEFNLNQAIHGDHEAFGLLYEQYVGRIFSYVYYRTGNQHEAEDLTAKVFFRAMRRIPDYEERGLPVSAWLYRIAHNLVANWHRDRGRRPEISLDEGYAAIPHSEHPEVTLLHMEEQNNLLHIIQGLPPERQQLIILKFVEHLSNAEIGQIMGRTEGAVKSLYHRTLLALRVEMDSLSMDEKLEN
ncbi:MAG: RNA polymerase subunit sigma-70 [Anaerolineales bacterium]|nr:sigma-70 family RNA polymerase sigma factor [Anaerolineae bacterium]PWB53833.1 MAG: RNA polymerase subunit sigma-70 [Anaerolineales bacterium]